MARRVRVPSWNWMLWCVVGLTLCGKPVSAQSAYLFTKSVHVASPFLSPTSLSLPAAPISVAAGDLNGDGHPDLVVTEKGSGSITVYLGNGSGSFGTGATYLAGTQPGTVLLADVNGDGKLDAVVADTATGSIDVLSGNGDGTFGKPVAYQAIAAPAAIALGNFDGKGKIDLAVAGPTGVAVLLNDGTGHFSSPLSIPLDRQPASLTSADFNGDGNADLAVANQDGTVTVMLGNGSGHFQALPAVTAAPGPLSSIVSADLNRDGKPDIAVTQADSNAVTVLLGQGDGSFQPGVSYTVGNKPAFLTLADVNGDSIPDLITVNQAANTFSVLLGNGDGTFRPSLDYVAGNVPISAAVGDFNSDGHADLAIVNSASATISVPLGRGDGTFKATRSYQVGLERKSIASGDLNGDGLTDFVVTNYCGSDPSCASGGDVNVFLASPGSTYRLTATYPVGSGPVAVALADVNGDRKLDLLVLNRNDKTFTVMPGAGNGTFGTAQTFPVSGSPSALFVGDFNGDGKPDLAIATDCGSATCTQKGSLEVLLGRGNGTFAASGTYAVGFSPDSIAAGALDGSGHLDLVVANACGEDSTCSSPGTATILAGDGTGKFVQTGEISLGKSPSAVALANLSGSGLDLIVAERGSNQISVLPSDGNGGFGAATNYAVGSAPSALAVADLNGDGVKDVAVSNFQSSTVSVLYGTASGALQSAVSLPVGTGPESMVVTNSSKAGVAGLVTANGDTGATPMGDGITPLDSGDPGMGTTSVTFTSEANSSTVDQAVTIAANVAAVSPTTPTPSGNLVFAIDTSTGGTGAGPFDYLSDCGGSTGVLLDGNGNASCTTQLLPAGNPVNIQLQYQGDSNFAANTSAADQGQTIAPDGTSVIIAPPIPGTVDQQVTLTADVDPNPRPTSETNEAVPFNGTVEFFSDGSPIAGCAAATAVNSGQNQQASATCQTTALNAAGSPHNITAQYNTGDPNFSASALSGGEDQIISPASTTVGQPTLVSPASPTADQVITLSATVAPQTGSVVTPFSGNMKFFNSGTAIPGCTAQPVGTTSGTAQCTISAGLAAGSSYSITAQYNVDGQDKNYFQSSLSAGLPLSVGKAATSVAVTPSTQTVNVDTSVSLTATVTPNVTTDEVSAGNVTAISGGTVTFSDGGTAISNCTGLSLTGGTATAPTATCSTTALDAAHSPHSITAVYTGTSDPNYATSPASAAATVNENKADTTTVVALSAGTNPSTVNSSVTFTATVTAPGNGVTLGGTVTFSDNGMTITNGSNCGSAGVVTVTWNSGSSTGTASCTTSGLKGGSHSIVANYSGDGNYKSSNNNVPQNVNPVSTTVAAPTLVSPASPTSGQTVTVSATVSSSGTLTVPFSGSMEFLNGSNPISNCTAVMVNTTTGVAQCQISGLGANTYSIKAQYNAGDASYSQSAESTGLSLVVAQATVTPTVGASPNPSTVNQTVTFTATLTTSLALTGTFSFTDTPPGGTAKTICSGVSPSSAGVATCTDNALTATSGTPHTIQATYSGDTDFASATGTLSGGQTVNMTNTSVAVSSSANPSTVNQSVTFSALVTPSQTGGVALGGKVAFTDVFTPLGGSAMPSTTICAAATVTSIAGGIGATCTIATLGLGSHAITATYSSDINFNGSSGTLTGGQTVNAASSNITLTSSSAGNTSTVNQTVTFTAAIQAPSGSTKLVGQVAFQDNGTTISGCAAVGVTATSTTNWTAVCADPSLTASTTPHAITASYGNDTNFSVGGGTLTGGQTVNKAGTTLAVISGANPSQVNVPVTFTATVTPNPTGSYAPTGTVAFTDNVSGAISGCTSAAVSTVTGQATCTTSALAVDQIVGGKDVPHVITAAYSGDSNFTTSSNTVSQTVQVNAETIVFPGTTTTVSTVNQSVSFTAGFTAPVSGTRPSGTETYTDNGNTIAGCTGLSPVLSSGTYVTTCTDSSFTAGTHTVVASYSGDNNLTVISGTTTLTVSPGASTVALTSSQNPSFSSVNNAGNYQDSVTFTAMVSPAQSGPIALAGAVTFSDNGTGIPGCIGISVAATAGKATCTTATLPSGADAVVATYSGDTNFTNSTFTLTQSVEDYSVAVGPVPATPQGVLITQGFVLSSDPFTPSSLNVTPTSISGFTGSPSITCTPPGAGAPKCSLSSASLTIVPGSVQQSVSVTLDATSATPGTYTFTITATDPTTSIVRTTTFPVTVRAVSAAVVIPSGATTNNTGTVTFVLPAGVTLSNLSCPSVAGTGITSYVEKPSQIGMACTINGSTIGSLSSTSPQSVTITVTVTTSGAFSSSMATPPNVNPLPRLLAAGLFGLPLFGLIGLLRGRKSVKLTIFRLLAILAISVAAFQTMGCGGSFKSTSTTVQGGTTPPGTYYLLIQGTGSDNNIYQSVLQVQVTLL